MWPTPVVSARVSFERVEFVIIPGAQIGAAAVLRRELQPIDTGEEIKAFVETVGQHLYMAQMRDVEGRIKHGQPQLNIVLGSRSGRSAGKRSGYRRRGSSSSQNGNTPRKIWPSSALGATDLTMKTFNADRWRDQPHFKRQDNQHAEPDRVDPKAQDHRKEDRQGQDQHGEPFQKTAQHQVKREDDDQRARDTKVQRRSGKCPPLRESATQRHEGVDHMRRDQDQHDGGRGHHRIARRGPEHASKRKLPGESGRAGSRRRHRRRRLRRARKQPRYMPPMVSRITPTIGPAPRSALSFSDPLVAGPAGP